MFENRFRKRLAPTLAFCGLLFSGFAAEAQIFDWIYGNPNQIQKLTSVIPTTDGGFAATALKAGGNRTAALLDLRPDGTVFSAKDYAGQGTLPIPHQVRELPNHGFVFVGSYLSGGVTVPFLVVTDPAGVVVFSRQFRLTLPNGQVSTIAAARYVEVDAQGGFYLGGDLWRQDLNRVEPWLARLDAMGNPLWIRCLDFFSVASLRGIKIAFDEGLLGVGGIQVVGGAGQTWTEMLTIKLDPLGNLVWAYRHLALNSRPALTEQVISDVDRDPQAIEGRSVVTGWITNLCPHGACDAAVPSVALLGILDESTGSLVQAVGLVASGASETRGTSIVDEAARHEAAVLGTQKNGTLPSMEGLLLRAAPSSGGVLAARRFGDGPGGVWGADTRSLERVEIGEPGYVFILNQTDVNAAVQENVVRTDTLLHSVGRCELPQEVSSLAANIQSVTLAVEVRNGLELNAAFVAGEMTLPQLPCDTP